MEKRWTLFLIITVLIYLFFMNRIAQEQKKRQRQKELAGTQETIEGGKELGKISTEADMGTTVSRLRAEIPPGEKRPTTPALPREKEREKETIIPIQTDLYRIELTNRGGRPARWDLLKMSTGGKDEQTSHIASLVEPLNDDVDRELPSEVDFREYNSRQSYSLLNRLLFKHQITRLPNGDIDVLFTSPPQEGVSITKRFLFRKNSCLTDLTITLHNNTKGDIVINDDGRGLGVSWGPGFGQLFNIQDTYEKRYASSVYSLTNGITKGLRPSETAQNVTGEVVWGGQNTRFLLAAIIPTGEKGVAFTSVIRPKNIINPGSQERIPQLPPASATIWTKKTSLPAEGSRTQTYKIFAGPREYNLLKRSGFELSRAMFYTHWGWMRALCILLLYILDWLHGLLNNYGVSIIGLTIIVRIITLFPTYKGMKIQAKAMAEQAKIRPLIEALNEKYKDNPQLKNKKLMELYKEHGINPLGFLRGCLPLLLQMPIFIALYFLLSESSELRGAGFLWIKDLAAPDRLVSFGTTLPLLGPYLNFLPILMGISQVFVSMFSSTAVADPNQKMMTYFFPIFFTFILYNLSSGLILYWLVSNILQAAQQFYINRHMKKEKAAQGA
ncbi:MAG: membrane protein insertase YidC [Candidatus Sumerlaeota bacterium]|nr:membrane protein insertase YidC [Candidatus Sumerlaeota bacterium]